MSRPTPLSLQLTYTHIDFHGSGKVPDTQPGVVYSDVKPQ